MNRDNTRTGIPIGGSGATQTERLACDDPTSRSRSLKRATVILKAGGIVAFPTETVYGVAASAANQAALARLREVKGRGSEQAFTVHLPRRSDARRYVASPPPLARRLARKAWPGPLTLICPVPTPEREEAR